MSTSFEAPVSVHSRLLSRPQTLGERLSKLPEELIIRILGSALVLLGPISKKNFWEGKCEWPGCLCENSDWEHMPGEELMNNTLLPWLLAPDPLPRLAQYVFFKFNTFHVCDPRSDMHWANNSGVWLPPQYARQWIQRLEVEVLIERLPRTSLVCDSPKLGRDVMMLRQMLRALEGFTRLSTLRLMFETAFVTDIDMLEMLDHALGTLEPFHFQTPELVLEACSAYPGWCDDVQEGDIARDERLETVLVKHVCATGTITRIGGKRDWAGGECRRWQGRL
ncbi:hypothetical protein E8E12_007528 [Didymella heteroderae]|uniref:Uncharacterized protein n=1 Tax=Didymella heteroderae TaxID=1769908 RepID=A0A9P4WZG5_9PLEO|nr:hypothetical protein E8E12_007528 [Didymella heteroderae]